MTSENSHPNDRPESAATPLTTDQQGALDQAASLLRAVGYDSWEAVDPIVPARCLLAADYLCLAGARPAELSIQDTAGDVRDAITAATAYLDQLPRYIRRHIDIGSAVSLVDHARSAL